MARCAKQLFPEPSARLSVSRFAALQLEFGSFVTGNSFDVFQDFDCLSAFKQHQQHAACCVLSIFKTKI